MKNIRIEVMRDNYITVTADTKRFGENEVMFEGNTFEQCFEYIKRELGVERLRLSTCLIYAPYTDRTGKTFPCYMEVAI